MSAADSDAKTAAGQTRPSPHPLRNRADTHDRFEIGATGKPRHAFRLGRAQPSSHCLAHMEQPPPLPDAKPPLGTRFYILLLAPLALMVLSICCISTKDFGASLLALAGLATFVCSIILGIQLGRRLAGPHGSSVGMSILMFLALQAFYGVCFFVGCTAAVMFS